MVAVKEWYDEGPAPEKYYQCRGVVHKPHPLVKVYFSDVEK